MGQLFFVDDLGKYMKWFVIAPFSKTKEEQWLGAFVPGNRHHFESVPAQYFHDRSRQRTSINEWADYFSHGIRARALASKYSEPCGFITCFPQLPLALGLMERINNKSIPILAWAFNIGHLPGGYKKTIARIALHSVNKFVVHSSAEIQVCSDWLQIPTGRFEFVPLQSPSEDPIWEEDVKNPYIIAMGSAGRDYKLLFAVLEDMNLPAVVVAGPYSVQGLKTPRNVKLLSGLSSEECSQLLQQSRICVTPLANLQTASGQVTLQSAMLLGKAQIVTKCPGSVDYLNDGIEALLVEPGSREDLKRAIATLWSDEQLRLQMGMKARYRALNDFSDHAMGLRLAKILDELELQQH